MKKRFPGYYHPTEKEFLELWKNCLFAFDANVLLNLYRYTPDTKNSLLAILEKVSDRVWLPYQAAYEYHNRRLNVIQQQMKAYDDVLGIIRKYRDELGGRLSSFVKHPSIQIHEILETFNDALKKFEGTLEKLKQEHPDFLIDDPIKETISGLFDGKVGEPTVEGELIQMYKQGEERYKLKRPPGYEDRDKGGTDQYSDLVMWFQLITKAKENKTPVIFVTDDRKEDWWLKSGGKTIGPRPELVQEFSEKAAITFYMYSADPFMEYARKHLKQKVEKKAIDEVREVRQRDEKEKSVSKAADFIRRIDNLLGGQSLVGSIRSDAVRKAFEDAERAKLTYINSPTADWLRKLTEDIERTKLTYINSATADWWQKLTEDAERAKLIFTNQQIDGSEQQIPDNSEKKVEDVPAPDAKKQDKPDGKDENKGDQ